MPRWKVSKTTREPTPTSPAHVPAVDVVVLSWGRLEDTLETLRSVMAQRSVSCRVWVVDQGSPPGQVAALRSFAAHHHEIHLIELDANIGVPAGRNLGIRCGTSEWVVSLDNDAVLAAPTALARAVERLEAAPRLGAVAFRADDFLTGHIDETSWVYPEGLRHREEPVRVTRFVGVGHALRRRAFEEVGGYDERLFFCEEELDLSYRLIGRGYHIVYDPSIVVLHKASPEARIGWDGDRVYYQTRNALLVHHRHHRRMSTTLTVTAGWLARAVYNGKTLEALRGIRDAIRLWRAGGDDIAPLTPDARRYIRDHDTRLRGHLFGRIRHQVLAALPGPRGHEEAPT